MPMRAFSFSRLRTAAPGIGRGSWGFPEQGTVPAERTGRVRVVSEKGFLWDCSREGGLSRKRGAGEHAGRYGKPQAHEVGAIDSGEPSAYPSNFLRAG